MKSNKLLYCSCIFLIVILLCIGKVYAVSQGNVSKRNLSKTNYNRNHGQVVEQKTRNETTTIEYDLYDLPDQIQKILNFAHGYGENDISEVYTKDEIWKLNLPMEFRQILCGDFSSVKGLRNEEERILMEESYEHIDEVKYLLLDLDGDNIPELCLKDGKGGIAAFYEQWAELDNLPGLVAVWTFSEEYNDINLITEQQNGVNSFFLKNGEIVRIEKNIYATNVSFDIAVHRFTEQGTMPCIDEIKITLVNELEEKEFFDEHGIQFFRKSILNENTWQEIIEEEATSWIKSRIEEKLISEDEWSLVLR